jgi:ACS family glucarate transporter-like MFS transporter
MSRSVDHAYRSPQLLPTGAVSDSPDGAATRVRYYIIALSMCMSLILYLDRFAVSSIAATLMNDLHLTKEQFGQRNMYFFWLYALFQVPAGALADRYGARRMLALYVIAWSLATMALGLVQGLVGLLGVHAIMGVAQAGAYPAAGSYLKRWANPTARAKANSLVAAGGRIGALVAFAMTAWIGLLIKDMLPIEQGWRGTFLLYGLIGISWTALFWWYFRDQPAEHAGVSAAEAHLIGKEPVASDTSRLPIAAMLSSPNVWLLSVSGFLTNVGWIFLTAWQTVYILENFSPQLQKLYPEITTEAGKKAFAEVTAGRLTAFAFCAAIAGGICGGIAADYLRRRLGPIWGRRAPGLFAGGVAGLLYLVCPWITDVWLFVGVMLIVSFTIDFGLGSLWATYQDIGGRHVGSVLGFANMWGNFGAGLCGWYYGRLADSKDWPTVFFISAVGLFAMAACWLLVNPTITLTERRPELMTDKAASPA